MKKGKRFQINKPALLLALAVLLLAASTVGSTRAALTYYSETYLAQVDMSSIGVTLVENGEEISSRDYEGNGWNATQGELLSGLLGEGEKLIPGKRYDEEIQVKNSGNIDTFVRVILTKSWKDKEGVKDTGLSPELIDLNLLEGNGWVVDEGASTRERVILYYTEALAPGESTQPLSDTLRIDHTIAEKVSVSETEKPEGTVAEYKYVYSGYSFCVDAEVNAVQTHNAQEAVKSAWGIDVGVSEDETKISLQ